MTSPSDPASSDSDPTVSGVSLSASVKEVIESGKDVASNVQSLVIDLLQRQSEPLESVKASVNQIMKTAEDVVKRAAPDSADSVLRNVIDGVASGVQSVAQSAGYAVEEAKARGQRFAGEDVEFAAQNLKAAGDILKETLKYVTERAAFESKTAAAELKSHAERAVESVGPTVASAVNALKDTPVQLATETTATAVKSGRLAAGALLSAMSGMLAGAADMLDPDRAKSSAASRAAGVNDQNAKQAE